MGFNSGFKGLNPLHVSSNYVLIQYNLWYNVLICVSGRPVGRPLTQSASSWLLTRIIQRCTVRKIL